MNRDPNFGGRSKAYGRNYSRRDVQAGSASTCYCRWVVARTPELSTRFNVKAINRFLLAEKSPDAVGF